MNEEASPLLCQENAFIYIHMYIYHPQTRSLLLHCLSWAAKSVFSTLLLLQLSVISVAACFADIQRHQRYQFVQGQANRLRQRANIMYQSFAHIRGRETAQKVEKQQDDEKFTIIIEL